MTTLVKGSLLEVSPLPALADTTTDDDSVVSHVFRSCESSVESHEDHHQVDDLIASDDVSTSVAPRDLFLSVLEKRLRNKSHSSTNHTPSHVKQKPLDRISSSNSRSVLFAKLMKKRRFKNFILLLQPKKKTFELIEIRYETSTATIGDMLDMIPQRATVSDFAKQSYVGFVRPKDGKEFTALDLMATGEDGADIEHHEVLVAINKGLTGAQVAQCSKPILANRKMIKLIAKSDKHKKHHRKNKHGSRHHHYDSSTKSHHEDTKNSRPAKTANIAVTPESSSKAHPSTGQDDIAQEVAHESEAHMITPEPCGRPVRDIRVASTRVVSPLPVETGSDVVPLLTPALSDDLSHSSTSSGPAYAALIKTEYHVITSKRSRRHERAKRRALMAKLATGLFGYLVVVYLNDSSATEPVLAADCAMGFQGLGRFLIVLLALVTMQKYVQQQDEGFKGRAAKKHLSMC